MSSRIFAIENTEMASTSLLIETGDNSEKDSQTKCTMSSMCISVVDAARSCFFVVDDSWFFFVHYFWCRIHNFTKKFAGRAEREEENLFLNYLATRLGFLNSNKNSVTGITYVLCSSVSRCLWSFTDHTIVIAIKLSAKNTRVKIITDDRSRLTEENLRHEPRWRILVIMKLFIQNEKKNAPYSINHVDERWTLEASTQAHFVVSCYRNLHFTRNSMIR